LGSILIEGYKKREKVEIALPGSKSESNRVLIINKMCDFPGEISNLSEARDTRIMQALLFSDNEKNIYNVKDAGTVMRFITAYLAIQNQPSRITGSDRMLERPIGLLVDALTTIGANIKYSGKTGYPPLQVHPFSQQLETTITIPGNISSQFISALLLIAPRLEKGLTIQIDGNLVSKPYVEMTCALLEHFGISIDRTETGFVIEHQSYSFHPYSVESDWSAASYWYSMFVLGSREKLILKGLRANSLQGDSILAKMMKSFGVKTQYTKEGVELSKQPPNLPNHLDFIQCPDLAQTFIVLCAALSHQCRFKGLQTLKIKETDRIAALQNELKKLGAQLVERTDDWQLSFLQNCPSIPERLTINTYHDHRMAMSFAPLALLCNVHVDDSGVVEKSYPGFWNDLRLAGFRVRHI